MAGQSVDATVVAILFRILATGGSHRLEAWRRANQSVPETVCRNR